MYTTPYRGPPQEVRASHLWLCGDQRQPSAGGQCLAQDRLGSAAQTRTKNQITVSSQCLHQRATPERRVGPQLHLRGSSLTSPNTASPHVQQGWGGTALGRATSPPAAFTSPPALQSRHWTKSSTN